MNEENVDDTCYYIENDIIESWQKMELCAKRGRWTWIKHINIPYLKLVSVLCCLGHCCVGKSEKCSLSKGTVVFIGRNEERRGLHIAIQISPEPVNTLSLEKNPNKIIWLEPYTGGKYFDKKPPIFGKDIDRLLGAEKCSGITLKLGCYVLADDSHEQIKIEELRRSRKWELKKDPRAIQFEVTGMG